MWGRTQDGGSQGFQGFQDLGGFFCFATSGSSVTRVVGPLSVLTSAGTTEAPSALSGAGLYCAVKQIIVAFADHLSQTL